MDFVYTVGGLAHPGGLPVYDGSSSELRGVGRFVDCTYEPPPFHFGEVSHG